MKRETRDIEVLKESGDSEDFDTAKLLESLSNSGVSTETAERILGKITPAIGEKTSTDAIFRMVKAELQSCDSPSRMRYSVKKAIYALGPTGYPFERYVGRVLEASGYKTRVSVIVKGRCVDHEVDVVARRGKELYMVECKFHSSGKLRSNVKTALYIHARFQDIRKAQRKKHSARGIFSRGMLVTNTRFTRDAIDFAECVGLKTMGWKHPRGESLERLIDRSKAYPVTVLPAVNRQVLDTLIKNGIILAKDIEGRSQAELSALTGIEAGIINRLQKQSRGVCG